MPPRPAIWYSRSPAPATPSLAVCVYQVAVTRPTGLLRRRRQSGSGTGSRRAVARARWVVHSLAPWGSGDRQVVMIEHLHDRGKVLDSFGWTGRIKIHLMPFAY